MNIHPSDIRGLLLISFLIPASGIQSQILKEPPLGETPALGQSPTLNPRLTDSPPADAYTTQPLLIASAIKGADELHHEERKLLVGNHSRGGLESLESHYRVPGTEADAAKLAESIKRQLKDDPARFARILEIEIAANPEAICEIVKAAIEAVEADAEKTARIIGVVARTAPESLRLAAQCAIAVNPSALQEVQACLAKVDPGAGDGSSAKSGSAKTNDVAATGKTLFSNRFGDPLEIPDTVLLKPIYQPVPEDIPEVSDADPAMLD